jgi:hypothetical protein
VLPSTEGGRHADEERRSVTVEEEGTALRAGRPPPSPLVRSLREGGPPVSFTDFVDLLERELHHHEVAMLTADGTVCTCGALTPDLARHQADHIAAELVSSGVVDWYEKRLGAA